jgi:hypothetical protein
VPTFAGTEVLHGQLNRSPTNTEKEHERGRKHDDIALNAMCAFRISYITKGITHVSLFIYYDFSVYKSSHLALGSHTHIWQPHIPCDCEITWDTNFGNQVTTMTTLKEQYSTVCIIVEGLKWKRMHNRSQMVRNQRVVKAHLLFIYSFTHSVIATAKSGLIFLHI